MLGGMFKWAALLACTCLVGTAVAQDSALAPAGAASAPQAAPAPEQPKVWLAGPQGTALTLEQALKMAKDGDTIELLQGDYPGGWVIEQRRLTLRGLVGGKPAVFRGDGKPGAAKALITQRGGELTLSNLEFRGARASDGSGAGARLESGRLRIERCGFFDNEHGLATSNDDKAEVHIDSSVFGLAPKVEGGLHHLLNVGRIAKLSITGSRFQQGFEGHLIKTRARENLITYNFIHDGLRGGASYEIDIANGGIATIVGNVIGQGADTQNPVLVGYGSEDRAWDKNQLTVVHNTFINHGWMPAWFMRVFTKNLPADVQVLAVNNLLVGGGVFSLGAPGLFEGNHHATRRMLRDLDTYAFELSPGSMWRNKGVDPRNVGGRNVAPMAEYEWPLGSKPLPKDLASWTPGAFQK
jgi:hypothetical protein